MLGGYTGKILRINLTSKKVLLKPLSEILARKFVGGFGTGGRLLYDEVQPSVEPFDLDNLLIFSTGPLTGTLASAAGRHTVVTKSPLTGYFGDASAGGSWGAELKFTGHDMLVITGKSDDPALIWINDDVIEIQDAKSYWGQNTISAGEAIRRDLGDASVKVVCIGPAGENLVKFAGIVSDDGSASRCGVGAVMGSKNLKAVAVRGSKQVSVCDLDNLKQLTLKAIDFSRTDRLANYHSAHGTPGNIAGLFNIADTPSYNWSDGEFGDDRVENLSWKDLDAEKLQDPGGYTRILRRGRSCFGCTLSCRRVISIEKDHFMRGPEYESLALLGANLGIDNVETVAKANQICDECGMDTMSAGSTIAFAMECYHRGLITRNDTDGLDLDFGNSEAVIEILHKISTRKGFGNILAEGSKRASQMIGKGSYDYAIQVKGLEIAAHDPRGFPGGGPHYACTPTGGRHTEGHTLGWEAMGRSKDALGFPKIESRFSTEGKSLGAKIEEDWMAFKAVAGFCYFADLNHAYPSEEDMVKVYSTVTGVPLAIRDALSIGERIFNMKKAFNVRHGATRADDNLPKRLLTQKNRIGTVVELEKTLPDYYEARGWNPETSIPKAERLNSLGLEDIAMDLLSAEKRTK